MRIVIGLFALLAFAPGGCARLGGVAAAVPPPPELPERSRPAPVNNRMNPMLKGMLPKQGALPYLPRNVPASEMAAIDEDAWPKEHTLGIFVKLGLRDTSPTVWDGSVTTEGCRLVRIVPWRFHHQMKVRDASAWQCASWLGPEFPQRPWFAYLPKAQRAFVAPGLIMEIDPDIAPHAVLHLKTAQGSCTVDVDRIVTGEGQLLLDGRIEAGLAMFAFPVASGPSNGPEWHDYPSVAISPHDESELWIAYQTYSSKDTGDVLMARRRTRDGWGPPCQVSERQGDYYRTAVVYDAGNTPMLVSAAQIDGNWDLYAWRFVQARWRGPERLTRDPQPDIHHRLIRDRDGVAWLVWQGFRRGRSHIHARAFDGASWTESVQVSPASAANDWEPAVCAHPDGGVVVVWDGYAYGQYDVFLRSLAASGGKVVAGKVIRVTGNPELEARPTVTCDRTGRAWVAYDTAGARWGKDTGFWLERTGREEGTRLNERKAIGVSVVDLRTGTVGLPPDPAPNFHVNRNLDEHIDYPHLTTDASGGVWLFFHRKMNIERWARGTSWRTVWEYYASRLHPATGVWSMPILVTYSTGRLDMHVALQATAGGIRAAWATSHRDYTGARRDMCNIFTGFLDVERMPPGDVQALALSPVPPFPPVAKDPVHPDEAADLKRVRNYRIPYRDAVLRIYRGDLHRHTENSNDGGNDGSLIEAYRYALDAADMDFLLVADHNDGKREYDWWQREKSNDLFHIGEYFVGLYGYERSASYPNGHRNIFFTRRGVRPLDLVYGETRMGGLVKKLSVNSGDVLYPYLRAYGGIAFGHSGATGMGTDWRDNDPVLEPIVEIFQGDRTSAEAADAPWAADPEDPTTWQGGKPKQEGFVSNALRKGYKLGFQASSDHMSTHLSYTCVLATGNTRQALMDAMKSRHIYGATDNIIMDVRAVDAQGDPKIMGDAFTSRGAPRFSVKVIGTGKLKDVMVIKDNRVVYTQKVQQGNVAAFTYTDPLAEQGREHFYYVRIRQADDNLAWASPMWITPAL